MHGLTGFQNTIISYVKNQVSYVFYSELFKFENIMAIASSLGLFSTDVLPNVDSSKLMPSISLLPSRDVGDGTPSRLQFRYYR